MSSRAYVVACSWILLALVAAHDVTHLADDGLQATPGQLAVVAIPQWLVLGAVMAIVLRGDPAQSRAAALVLGLSVTAGFAVVHFLPFSPAAFWDQRPSPVSWTLAWAAAVAGVLLAIIAWPRRAGVSRPGGGGGPSPR